MIIFKVISDMFRLDFISLSILENWEFWASGVFCINYKYNFWIRCLVLVRPKRFWTHPNQLRQAQKRILFFDENVLKPFQTIWTGPKSIWTYFGPMEGQGIIFKELGSFKNRLKLWFTKISKKRNRRIC